MNEDPDEFDDMITAALKNLPPEFRAQLDSVAIVIDDYPTSAQLAATHSHGLFGIYEGVPRTSYAADYATVPSKITLFRAPLRGASRSPEELVARVEETLFHEIGHHLGISDDRLYELARERHRRT